MIDNDLERLDFRLRRYRERGWLIINSLGDCCEAYLGLDNKFPLTPRQVEALWELADAEFFKDSPYRTLEQLYDREINAEYDPEVYDSYEELEDYKMTPEEAQTEMEQIIETVNSHSNGKVGIEYTPGKGYSLWQNREGLKLTNMRVLLYSRDKDLLDKIASHLKKHGYTLIMAASEEEAEDALYNSMVGSMIVDVDTTVADSGFDLCQRLRASYNFMPAMFLFKFEEAKGRRCLDVYGDFVLENHFPNETYSPEIILIKLEREFKRLLARMKDKSHLKVNA